MIAVAATFVLASPAWATWSVVGVDPSTGQVGVAVASCVPFDVGQVAVVVPGEGAGASQAKINVASGDPLAQAIATEASPEDVIEAVTSPAFDPDAASRQFGVVLLGKGGAGFSGAGNEPVSLDRRNAEGTVSVQGNILTSERVVEDAVEAFDRVEGPLADRLLAALKAGSEAGGDSRCGDQTASSATLIVAEPGDPVWAYTDSGFAGSPAGSAAVPSTYISIVNRRGGANPVDDMIAAYDSATPVDGRINVREVQFGGEAASVIGAVAIGAVVAVAVLAVIIAVVVRTKRRRRAREDDSTRTGQPD